MSGVNRIGHPDWVKLSVELNCAPNQNTKFSLPLHCHKKCRGTCYFGIYVWSPKIYVVVWYMFSGILFLFILGKRHMETNVEKMVMI